MSGKALVMGDPCMRAAFCKALVSLTCQHVDWIHCRLLQEQVNVAP